MIQRQIPIVVRKNGEMLVAKFPVELTAGDQIIVAKELVGVQVPEGEKWTVNGFTDQGPVVTNVSLTP